MKYQCKRYRVIEERLHGESMKVFQGRPKTLIELLDKTVIRYPDKEGFISAGPRLTFREFGDLVENMAFALQRNCKVKKGDRVALLMGTEPEFPLCLFAAAKVGGITVPLNTRFTAEELSYEINNSEPTVLIMDKEYWEVIKPHRNSLKTVNQIFIHGNEIPSGALPISDLTKRQTCKAEEVKIREDDVVMLMYTSGTTGFPKGAMQHHRGIVHACMLIEDLFQIDPDRDRMLNALPMFHAAGTIMSSITAILTGIPCIYLPRFKAHEVLETIEREKITTMVHVPTAFSLMVNHPEFERYNLSSFRAAIVGGAPKSRDLINLIRMKIPHLKINDTFGMTETHTMDCILLDEELDENMDSIGRVVPIDELRVVDPQGNECPQNVSGEILIKGAKIISGYWKNPEETKKAIVDGWLHTGDVGRMDEKGYVYVLDRMKDMINRGGENIYSLELENTLKRHPKVMEAAVVGVPDPIFGEEVKAYLILKDNEKATEEEIKGHCKTCLADYKVPKHIEFVSALPRSSTGKILKEELRRKR